MTSIYLQITYYCWAIVGLIWLVSMMGTKRTVRRPELGRYFLTTLIIIASYVLLFGDHNFAVLNYSVTPQNAAFGIIGDIVSIASALFAIWARFALGTNWSGATAALKKDHELVQKGPYRIVRHPIYTGLLFLMLGTAFTIGTLSGYLGVLMGLIAFLMRIPMEERLMLEQFHDTYVSYRQKVRALIPFVW